MSTTHSTARARNRSRLTVGLGIAAGVALAVGAPLAASAHVNVTPGTPAAGSNTTLTFAFSHGCDGAPTTALAIEIPEGVAGVKPNVQAGWTITVEEGEDGVPTSVTYTTDTPVEDGYKASVALDVLLGEDTAGSTLAFPTVQSCTEGENAWVEIAEEGEDPHDLDSPAPVVTVGEATDDGHGHGEESEETDDHAATDDTDGHSDSADATDASASADDPVARWLAAGGLVAGLAALGVSLWRTRKS
ncbi:hypothetical protein GCM10022200_12350 [Microbacterium awajiense]|uniref:YncI copper-binding domain-containing protein n=1 Tax=Microbacterium awajiense TaxID=415214 RepID=A0ABP7AFN6_9MICO